MEKIVWTKKYQEDHGAMNEDGFYDYSYRYFTYWFLLPDNQKIRGRRYADTPGQCSLYIALDDLEPRSDAAALKRKDYISGIVNFLLVNEGVEKIEHFSEGYKPVDMTTIKDNLK